jgi:hypothetical protein
MLALLRDWSVFQSNIEIQSYIMQAHSIRLINFGPKSHIMNFHTRKWIKLGGFKSMAFIWQNARMDG